MIQKKNNNKLTVINEWKVNFFMGHNIKWMLLKRFILERDSSKLKVCFSNMFKWEKLDVIIKSLCFIQIDQFDENVKYNGKSSVWWKFHTDMKLYHCDENL